VNNTLADQGEAIFSGTTANSGCVACHGIKPGITRPIGQKTWATPVLDVGTDTREYDILAWTAQSGVMNGAYTAADSTPIKPVDSAIDILGMAVAGAIEQYCLENTVTCLVDGSALGLPQRPKVGGLKGMFKVSTTGAAYESRVLQGIWAAAPYLHNGSVPTLAELLKPAAERVKERSPWDAANAGGAGQPRSGGGGGSRLTGCPAGVQRRKGRTTVNLAVPVERTMRTNGL